LIGNPSKAKNELGWEAKVGIEELVGKMMRNDMAEAQKRQQHG
jgi:GDP-D-mannose dehydratase